MKLRRRNLHALLLLALLVSCAPARSAVTDAPATLTPEPTDTAAPALTATATFEPTRAPLPTAYPTIAFTPVQPVTELPQGTDGYPWWNDTVFYEIFVRSFYDSNGDGIGDFNGMIEKLDYLNDGDPATTTDLGIAGLWLMPIHPSPSYHGYDVTDFYAVNPEYGTLDDFRRLVAEAHARGIRITIDWVLNHTSSQHPWFLEGRDPASPYHEWYVWTTEQFPGKGWRYGGSGGYYYANVAESMPDLNYTNPDVVAEMKDVMRFWLVDVGIDGFRLDAAKHIVEEGPVTENTTATHEFYKDLRPFYKSIKPDAMLVGEVADQTVNVSKYLAGDELDLAFDFDLATKFTTAGTSPLAEYVTSVLDRDLRLFQPNQFATFLTNHDHNRAMSTIGGDVNAAKTAAMFLLTSPGVPFIYYGEEIGLTGTKPDENIRLPMQWTDAEDAGFTTGVPWRAPNSDYSTKNVTNQSADPDSLLSFYRELIRIRNNHAALRVGDFQFLDTGNRSLYASIRSSKEETVLILINLSAESISEYALALESSSLAGNYRVIPLLGFGEYAALQVNAAGGFTGYQPVPEIPAFARLILQIHKE